MAGSPASLLITVTGNDRPGVTGALFGVLDRYDVTVVDVEQVVVRGALTLAVLVTGASDTDALARDVVVAVRALGLSVRISGGVDGLWAGRSASHVVLVMGRPLAAHAVAALAARFAADGVNILTIRRLADEPVTGLELAVAAIDEDALRAGVGAVGAACGVDIAVSRAGLERRSKRLIVFDVDSTLVAGEVIEMLAERAGQLDRVAEITAAAMRGELDFAAALHERVALLAGLDATVLDEVGAALPLTPGARTTIETLQRLGFRCGVVSGGFTQVTRHLVESLRLDYAAANTLEVVDGRLTGRVVGDIVDRAGKAAALVEFAGRYGVPLSQTVAVGDGANDIDMLTTAGLGIAFNAKPIVAGYADTAVNQPFLDPVLLILGIARDEVRAGIDAGAAVGRGAAATGP